ncbi:MAG: response regulator [Clostridiales Family XIII bacterium]|jgi:CheY-like chemotaxis protein/two-component sensor histidine kinase|nr:response regulator [Clostridiales Family XIII bacterium]
MIMLEKQTDGKPDEMSREELLALTRELAQARLLAEDANAAKDHFIASVSHEIRTPLNVILGLAEMELQKDLPTGTILNFEKIYAAGTVLLGLINDILDVSKIKSGKFDLFEENYDFSEMISEVISINVVHIASKNMLFHVDVDENIPAGLKGDATRVRQILNNLLSNAFKFTTQGSVTLRITCEPQEDSVRLACTVSDTGQGIRKEDMNKLFKDYSQIGTQASHQAGGVGLGLSICRNLVETMDGEISVESEYGKGSSFTAEFKQAVADVRPIGPEVVRKLKKFQLLKTRRGMANDIRIAMPEARILIVDDVMTNLDVAKGLMARYGLTVHCVSNGQKAVDLIRDAVNPYDMVFMDHMMPEMDGITAVQIIRNEIGTIYAETVPIIMLTANVVSGRREMFLQSGVDDFLSKPIDVARLDYILRTWIPKEKQKERHPSPVRPTGDGAEETAPFAISGVSAGDRISTLGSVTFYMTVLQAFCRDADEKTAQIRNCADTGDFGLYTTLVHGLKGAARNIGANDFAAFAEKMENAGKNKDAACVHGKTERLLSDLRILTEDIRAALSMCAKNEETVQLTGVQVESLKAALINSDVETVNRLLLEYLEMPLDEKTRNAVSEIEQNVLLYEYAAAVQATNALHAL